MEDYCETVSVLTDIQENGIIRLNGRFIGRIQEDEEINFEYIKKQANEEQGRLLKLPCKVDEMRNLTEEEQQIFSNHIESISKQFPINILDLSEETKKALESEQEAIEVLKHIGDFIAIDDEYGLCYAPELVKALELARKALEESEEKSNE